MFRHSTKLILAGLTTAAVMATGGCSKNAEKQQQGSAQVAVHALSLANITAMDVAVSGGGIATPINMPLFKTGGTWQALVNHIPVGTHTFSALAYDSVAKTHQIYSGSVAGVTISKNEIADVVIVMQEDHAPNGFGNHAPIVDSLSVSSTSAIYGEKIAYTLAAHDPDPNETLTLTFQMDPSCGSFPPTTATMNGLGQMVWSSLWTAPPSGTSCQLNMVITDINGAKAMAAVTISLSAGVDVGGARVSTLVESYPVLTGITTDPAIISGAYDPNSPHGPNNGSISLSVLYSMSDNEPARFKWTAPGNPGCTGSFDNDSIQSPVFTLTTVPSSIPPICTFTVVVSGPDRTPTGGTGTTGHLSTIGSLTVNVGQTIVAGNPGGGVAIDMTSQSLESADPNQPVTLYVKASEHTTGATLTSYLWSAVHGSLALPPTNAPDLSDSQVVWTAPSSLDPNEAVNVVVTDSLGATASYTFIIHQHNDPCLPNGSDNLACSDGDPCTVGDHCLNHACVPGTPNPCTAIDGCHENGTCDHVTGSCSTPLSANGKDCSDGDACTLTDKCAGGVCTPTGGTTQCHALDQCHVAGVCDHRTGVCSDPTKPDNSGCDDQNVCTTGETCQNGQCTGGVLQTTCQPTDSCHLVGTCNPVTGCSTPPAPDTTLCNFDNDGCTVGDHCSNGVCVAGAPMSCQPVDLCHLAGTCIHPAGTCATGAWSIQCPATGPSAGSAVACSFSNGQCGSCATPTDAKAFAVSSIVGMGLDSSGRQYVSASLFGTANFGSGDVTDNGGGDVVVAKLVMDPNDPNDPHWTRKLGDGSSQIATGLAVGQTGRVAVTGTYSGVVTAGNSISNTGDAIDFIAALDNNGNGLWAKSVDTKGGSLTAIAGNPDRDEFVMCGYTMPCTHVPNSQDTCSGPMTDLGVAGYMNSDNKEDIFIAKLNSTTGAVIWARQYGLDGAQLCNSVALDSQGNVFATGVYNGHLDHVGTPSDPNDPPVHFGPGFLDSFASTVQAIWVAKLDGATGNVLLAKDYGGTGLQSSKSIALDSSGDVAITGSMTATLAFGTTSLVGLGNTDGFLAKLDQSLLPVWAARWGDGALQEAHSVAFNSAGDLVVVGSLKGIVTIGSTKLTNSGSATTDAYFAKFRGSDGMPLCAANYGTAGGNQTADSVAISGVDGKISMAGLAAGTFSFGTLPYVSAGGGFVLQLTTP